MKRIIIIIFLLQNLFIFSQNILDLDNLKLSYQIKNYNLNTKEMYGIDKTIEMYNIFTDPNTVFLVSVLPNFDNNYNWIKVDYDSIVDKILTKQQFESKISNWLNNNTPDKKNFEYKLLKKKAGYYYITEICLAEIFNIAKYPTPIISGYGVINTADFKVSISQMKLAFEKLVPKQEFPLDVRNEVLFKNIDNNYAIRNYLSKEYKIKGDIAYQFWTLDGWWIQDGYNKHRGIDRFIYIPEKGIVGGSYDFYFAHKPKLMYNNSMPLPVSSDKLWDNIINEKVMIAEELK